MSMIAKDINNIQRSVKCDTDGTLLVGGITLNSVTVSIVPSTSIVSYGGEINANSSVTTTLLEYTNTTGGLVLMDGFSATGEVDGRFEFYVDGVVRMVRRSSEQDRNIDFFLPTPLRIADTHYIWIKVEHYRGSTASFNCSLFAHRS